MADGTNAQNSCNFATGGALFSAKNYLSSFRSERQVYYSMNYLRNYGVTTLYPMQLFIES